MEVGWTCSLCHLESAECFCCCGNSEALLCRKCLSTHYDKFPKRMHQKMPLAAYGHHKAPGYLDRLNVRIEAVDAGKQALLQQLQVTDRCLEEVNTKVTELSKRIMQAGQQACEGVRRAQTALQAKVQLSIEEAERTVYEDNPVLSEVFSLSLRAFTGEFPFTLFQYDIKVCETIDSMFKVTYKSTTEVPQTSKSANPVSALSGSKWTCTYCRHEDNLRSSTHCNKCRRANPQIPSLAERNKADIPRLGTDSTIWTCSCRYACNLITSKICTNCGLANPFLPAKPLLQKCVQCGIHEVTQSTDICSICRNAPADSYRTCIHCLHDNNLLDEWCLMCHQALGFMRSELKEAGSRLSTNWKCGNCSYMNHSSRLKCTMCSQSKAAFHCKVCGTANKSETGECIVCGQGSKNQQPKADDRLRLQFSNMKIKK